jgi:hypothetical protein
MKITMLMLSILTTATATAACFALPTLNVRHAAKANADVRGLARVHLRQGRVLVSGPAIVRHLETEGDGVMMLYLTDDPGIGDRGCPGAAAEASPLVAALRGQSRIADLRVPAGKRICASVEDGKSMRVAWHASPTGAEAGNRYEVALLPR